MHIHKMLIFSLAISTSTAKYPPKAHTHKQQQEGSHQSSIPNPTATTTTKKLTNQEAIS
jgi:hypothetical protein